MPKPPAPAVFRPAAHRPDRARFPSSPWRSRVPSPADDREAIGVELPHLAIQEGMCQNREGLSLAPRPAMKQEGALFRMERGADEEPREGGMSCLRRRGVQHHFRVAGHLDRPRRVRAVRQRQAAQFQGLPLRNPDAQAALDLLAHPPEAIAAAVRPGQIGRSGCPPRPRRGRPGRAPLSVPQMEEEAVRLQRIAAPRRQDPLPVGRHAGAVTGQEETMLLVAEHDPRWKEACLLQLLECRGGLRPRPGPFVRPRRIHRVARFPLRPLLHPRPQKIARNSGCAHSKTMKFIRPYRRLMRLMTV